MFEQNRSESFRSKIIPIFLPHQGCPHHCIFCNQKEVTGTSCIHEPADVYPLIEQYLKTINHTKKKKPSGFPKSIEVAFYGGNFTGMPQGLQKCYLLPAYQAIQEGRIDGIRISTRPDYISEKDLNFLAQYGVRTIEIGVQSLDQKILQKAGRTYSEKQVIEAMHLLHHHQFCIGLHLMVGLPEESDEALCRTVEKVIELAPHFVRIHPTLVIKNTELEKIYRLGNYTPLTLEKTIELCKGLFLQFAKAGITVARIGLQSIPEMEKEGIVIAGPFHPALGELVVSSLAYDQMVNLMAKEGGDGKRVTILVPERELSIFLGQHRQNLHRLQQKYRGTGISIAPDKSLERGKFECIMVSDTCMERI